MTIPESIHHPVKTLIREWLDAYQSKNLQAFVSLCSLSETHCSFGTGTDEQYIGRSHFLEFLKRDFAQSDQVALTLDKEYIVINDNWAWAALLITPELTSGGHTQTLPTLRGTLVLKKEDDKWFIEHHHASWPYPSQPQGQSFPT